MFQNRCNSHKSNTKNYRNTWKSKFTQKHYKYCCTWRPSTWIHAWQHFIKLSIYTCEHFVSLVRGSQNVCKWFIANHVQMVFSTNTKDVHSSVGTVIVWIFVLFHVCGKIFLSCLQFSWNCRCSWFVIFAWFAGSSWKIKLSEQVCEHNIRKCAHSWRFENRLLHILLSILINFFSDSRF